MRNRFASCNLASHPVQYHDELVGEVKLYDVTEVRTSLRFTLLETFGPNVNLNKLRKKEDIWRTRLESWVPAGLNVRED